MKSFFLSLEVASDLLTSIPAEKRRNNISSTWSHPPPV